MIGLYHIHYRKGKSDQNENESAAESIVRELKERIKNMATSAFVWVPFILQAGISFFPWQ